MASNESPVRAIHPRGAAARHFTNTNNEGIKSMKIRMYLVFLALAMAAPLHAATFCVDTAADLKSALQAAQANGENDIVKVVASSQNMVVDLSTLPVYASSEDKNLFVLGGYNADCSALAYPGAKSTITASGLAPNAHFSVSGSSTALIRLQRIRWWKGHADQNWSAFEINTSGSLQISQCSFVYHQGSTEHPFPVKIAADGDLVIENSIIGKNVAGNVTTARSIEISSNGSGTAYLNNNTISFNMSDTSSDAAVSLLGTRTWSLTNNIIWDNFGSPALQLPATVELRYNDLDGVLGTPVVDEGNVNVNPLLENPFQAKFRPIPGSPVVDIGLDAPPGGVSGYDFDDNLRIVGRMDLGAYENLDLIFADDFEIQE